MVAKKTIKDPVYTNAEIVSLVEEKTFASIKQGHYTKSIYFKDENDDFSCFIFNLTSRSCSLFATINKKKYNIEISSDKFNSLFSKYKIFLI